jgi:hypothetical protein
VTGLEELTMRISCYSCLGLVLAVAAQAQQQPELRARELFYTPIAEVKPVAAPAKQVGSNRAKPAPRPTQQRANTSEHPQRVQAAGRQQNHPDVGMPESARLQKASTLTPEHVSGAPLVLKYRLLKLNADGRYDEVDTDSIFRSGDKIRVSVESNDDGYLYIVQQGSSKMWNLLFPNKDTEHGSNKIDRHREIEIPGGARFTFDEQPGNERLFIVLTRRPEPDLEQLIYALSQSGAAKQPASVENANNKPKMLMASSRIDDNLIERLRGKLMARDLVFEKVNDPAPVSTPVGTRKEKALYVATQDRSPDARVVVDLNLKHQ